jgi:hypothetical protein
MLRMLVLVSRCSLYTRQMSLRAVRPTSCVIIPHRVRKGTTFSLVAAGGIKIWPPKSQQERHRYPFDTSPVEPLCQSALGAQKSLPLRRTQSQ